MTRGLLLILLELTIIRASWTFTLDYSQFLLAGVIWMLGWCMVLLAGLIWLPTRVLGIVGLLIIVGQSAFGAIGGALPPGRCIRSGSLSIRSVRKSALAQPGLRSPCSTRLSRGSGSWPRGTRSEP